MILKALFRLHVTIIYSLTIYERNNNAKKFLENFNIYFTAFFNSFIHLYIFFICLYFLIFLNDVISNDAAFPTIFIYC